MQESLTATINHEMFDADVVECMGSYLQNGTYHIDKEAEKSYDELNNSDEEHSTGSVNRILMAHIDVYNVAEYYQMNGLKSYVRKRFMTACEQGWHPDGFLEVVKGVYEAILSDKKSVNRSLRDTLEDYSAKHRADIMRDTSVMDELAKDKKFQGFLSNLFKKSVRQEILNDSRHAQEARQRQDRIQVAEESFKSFKEEFYNQWRVMNRLANAIPTLPGTCRDENCGVEFPGQLKFVREGEYPPGHPQHHEISGNEKADWVIKCSACDCEIHREDLPKY